MIFLNNTVLYSNFTQISNFLILDQSIDICAFKYICLIQSFSAEFLQKLTLTQLQKKAGFTKNQHTKAINFLKQNNCYLMSTDCKNGKCVGKKHHFDFSPLLDSRVTEKPSDGDLSLNYQKNAQNRLDGDQLDKNVKPLPATPKHHLAGGDDLNFVKAKCLEFGFQNIQVWLLQLQILKTVGSVQNPRGCLIWRMRSGDCSEALQQISQVEIKQKLDHVHIQNEQNSRACFDPDPLQIDKLANSKNSTFNRFAARAKNVQGGKNA